MANFVHLHHHSDFSLLDGAAPVGKMVKRAKDLGMNALALTDHGNLFGSLKFYKECKKEGIKPLVGCEVYVAPGSRFDKKGQEDSNRYYHLVLIVKNETGWKNLMKMVSAGYTEGFYYKPRVDHELLERYHEGLICLSACLAGEIPQFLLGGQFERAKERALWYSRVFGPDHYWLELQDHGLEEQQRVNPLIVDLARDTGLPLVATNDAHYLTREDANAQDTLVCIGTNKKKNDLNRMSFGGDEFYMKSPEEMLQLFQWIPEALENTQKVADLVDLNLNLPGPLLPDYEVPEDFLSRREELLGGDLARLRARMERDGQKAEALARLDQSTTQYMVWMSNDGLKRRYGQPTVEMVDRLDFELSVIIRMDFVGYFLIVADFINWAKDHDVPVGPGRGSGAGSIVAYVMRITDIDPLKYKLLFERFLNPERVSMPDFDVDFADEGRGDVISYVTDKYGKDKVGQIITFGTLKTKAVLKDVARALDISFNESNEISKLVPDDAKDEKGKPLSLMKLVEQEPTLQEFYNRGGVYRELFDTAARLEGMSRHASTHAAGVVIGKTELTDYVPLYKDPKTGAISTQFTMDQLEECGLVKMDFLGLKTLTIIKNTLALINKRGIPLKEEDIPEDDKATFKMLGEGKSSMVFQFESQGMQKVLKQAKPTSIEDLIALNALYRPGPMDYIPDFIKGKFDKNSIHYPHPSLEPILKETYGVMVYQEQVMQAAQILAGYSLGGADLLRRAMGKKKKEEMDKQRAMFVEGCKKQHNIDEKRAGEIFEILEKFAGYGFNKSHAAAYSVIAYKTAFLKANYPAEYLAANLTNEITNPDKLAEYLDEAKEMGLKVLPPHVNFSEMHFSVHEGRIAFGLLGVKNVGEASVEEILRARAASGPFTSFQDFLERVDLTFFNAKVFETSIQCGLFDGLGYNRATLWTHLERWVDLVKRHKAEKASGQTGLFDDTGETALVLTGEEVPEWPKKQILEIEKANLGLFVSGHPLDEYREEWKTTVTLDLSKALSASADSEHQVFGILKNLKVLTTKTGGRMAFADLEDFKGSIEVVFFPRTFEQFQTMLDADAVVGVKGKLKVKDGKPSILADTVVPSGGLAAVRTLSVHIQLKPDTYDAKTLGRMRDFLLEHAGPSPVFLHYAQAGQEAVIQTHHNLSVSPNLTVFEALKAQSWAERVWKE